MQRNADARREFRGMHRTLSSTLPAWEIVRPIPHAELLGDDDEAEAANRRALELTANDAERRLLTTRLHRRPLDDGS